jgi:hypothetical protein
MKSGPGSAPWRPIKRRRWSLRECVFVCPHNVPALRYDDAKGVRCAGPRLEFVSDEIAQNLVRGMGVITGRSSNLHEPILPVSPAGPESKHRAYGSRDYGDDQT